MMMAIGIATGATMEILISVRGALLKQGAVRGKFVVGKDSGSQMEREGST
jgi:hypothetical protein